MKLNGAAILIECLIEQEVGTVFGFPGGMVVDIYDKLYDKQDKIKHILTHFFSCFNYFIKSMKFMN